MGELVPLPSRSGFGLDRLSVSFPIRQAYGVDDGGWDRVTRGRDGSESALVVVRDPAVEGASVVVGAMVVGGRMWGKVEGNPSRLADPAGCSLLPPREFDAAACALWEVARAWVEPGCDLADAKVKRLDVARDFRQVAEPAFFVRGLLNVRRPYARRTFLYADPAKGNAETLFAGSGAGGVRLYDQHEAYADKGAPEGSLRWEVEARSDWLEKAGVTTVSSVDVVKVGALAQERWEWSQMGVEVTGACNLVERVQGWVRAEKLSQVKADRLIGQLVRESFGMQGRQSFASAAEYSALKRELGVVPSAELFGSFGCDTTVRARLDFETGFEVAA